MLSITQLASAVAAIMETMFGTFVVGSDREIRVIGVGLVAVTLLDRCPWLPTRRALVAP